VEPTSEVPDIEVRIDNKDLPAALYAALLDVDVQDDTEAPSACRLSFVAWDEEKIDVSRIDDTLFDMGKMIEIKLGTVSALQTVCKVEIVGVELELSSGQAPRLSVRGYDKRHRLRRGTRTRTFKKMKDSDIAAQIAQENNLSPKVEDSKLSRDYVLQEGKSDLDFLGERAAAIGFEVVVDGNDLLFRPAKASGSPLTLKADQDLTDLSAHLKAVDQVGAVEVRGWDPENKQEIVGKSSGAGQPPAAASGDSAFGKATIQVVDRAVTKQDEADSAALAAFEKRARRSMGVQGSCPGRTDLRAGIDVDIQGAGARFSGVYRLTSVSHRFSPRSGFSTSFSGERKLT
jgi:phage protein D